VFKVLNYASKTKLLEKSSNPFATVLLAQLASIALAKETNTEQHLVSKLKLIRCLYKKGLKPEAIGNLIRFIDWVIQLPEALMLKCREEIHKIEESQNMTYISSFERVAKQEGRQSERTTIIKNLYKRLKDAKKVAEISGISLKSVQAILDNKAQKA
jgi:hypothetical protein